VLFPSARVGKNNSSSSAHASRKGLEKEPVLQRAVHGRVLNQQLGSLQEQVKRLSAAFRNPAAR